MKPAEAFTFTVGNATDTQSNKTILHNCIIYVICKAEQPKDYNKLNRTKCLKWHKIHDKGGKKSCANNVKCSEENQSVRPNMVIK